MPNPDLINCNEGEWTPIATDQVWGHLYKMDKKPAKYLYTYRLTGEAAPINQNEGTPIFVDSDRQNLVFGVGVDIYVMAIGNDGQVRYDWWF